MLLSRPNKSLSRPERSQYTHDIMLVQSRWVFTAAHPDPKLFVSFNLAMPPQLLLVSLVHNPDHPICVRLPCLLIKPQRECDLPSVGSLAAFSGNTWRIAAANAPRIVQSQASARCESASVRMRRVSG